MGAEWDGSSVEGLCLVYNDEKLRKICLQA